MKEPAIVEDSARRGRKNEYLKFYLLVVLFGLCVLFYYSGEIVDIAGWTGFRWSVLYSVHDLHRLFYMAPVVYAAYFFGARALIIVLILTTASFLPRAIFVSPFPDPLLRSMAFVAVAAVVGWVVATSRSQALKFKQERDRLLSRRGSGASFGENQPSRRR